MLLDFGKKKYEIYKNKIEYISNEKRKKIEKLM